ncbi:uncharacterized protein LOC117317041 [Pecten maximus]|uniref:uncharacterized protein LOC117317041 n=1 Tax=Pecten maximus TaxID=6579 RepID=UPI0014581A4A|nr:uncharacterized protein LOC117317041 [Pecten maximus]
MSSTIKSHDSRDSKSQEDNDDVSEPIRDLPNENGKQTTDVCSEQSYGYLQEKHTDKKTEDDIQLPSNVPDQHTDIIVQSENDQAVLDAGNLKPVYLETTYFGSPKKLSAADIVVEIKSSIKQSKLTNVTNSKETGDKLDEKLDNPITTPTTQGHSNGLAVSENAPQSKKSQPRGILKNTKSEPVIIISEHIEKIKHSDSTGLIETSRPAWPRYGKRKFVNVSTSANFFRNTQEFVNPAFELDENLPSDSKLSDIVNLVIKQQTDQDRYVHPFGQSNLYSSMFLDDTPTAIQNTERVIFWLIFVIMLVGLAGAIILMAEMYRLEKLDSNALVNTTAVAS